MRLLSTESPHRFIFADRLAMDISDKESVDHLFELCEPHVCVNLAAYTGVDKAEEDREQAYQSNATAVHHIVEACRRYETLLIHVSTDFVFDGHQVTAYREQDHPAPLSVYGKSKWEGEQHALKYKHAIILRTSWVYSSFGKNFVKTMLRLGKAHEQVNVVQDQIGSPTYARDLAEALLRIIEVAAPAPARYSGIYHFANEGIASWYDFAHAIFEITSQKVKLTPIRTEDYPTAAVRPKFSVLDKSKVKDIFGIRIRHWRDALRDCLRVI